MNACQKTRDNKNKAQQPSEKDEWQTKQKKHKKKSQTWNYHCCLVLCDYCGFSVSSLLLYNKLFTFLTFACDSSIFFSPISFLFCMFRAFGIQFVFICCSFFSVCRLFFRVFVIVIDLSTTSIHLEYFQVLSFDSSFILCFSPSRKIYYVYLCVFLHSYNTKWLRFHFCA